MLKLSGLEGRAADSNVDIYCDKDRTLFSRRCINVVIHLGYCDEERERWGGGSGRQAALHSIQVPASSFKTNHSRAPPGDVRERSAACRSGRVKISVGRRENVNHRPGRSLRCSVICIRSTASRLRSSFPVRQMKPAVLLPA